MTLITGNMTGRSGMKRRSGRKSGRNARAKKTAKAGSSLIDEEKKCVRCGRCCRIKTTINGKHVAFKDRYCEFLDRDTKLCMVYPMRHAYPVVCLSAEAAAIHGLVPDDCPYAVRESVIEDWEHE